MKKNSMLVTLILGMLMSTQLVISQNRKEHKGIPMRDVESYSITYPVYLTVHATDVNTGMPLPGVYVYTECLVYAWGSISYTKTMATGVTDEIGCIEDYRGDPIGGGAMDYRMKIVVRLPLAFSSLETNVEFYTGLTDVHILANINGISYVEVRYNNGSKVQAPLR